MLIGITGPAGSGKDTIAGLITSLISARIYHFAGPVKSMALAIDPIVEVGKNPDGSLHLSRLSHIVELYGWHTAKQIPEVRRFLQRLGTEGARETFGPNCWVDLARDWWYDLDENIAGVIPDTRFANEANFIWDEGGTIIQVTRSEAYDLGANSGHASERGIDFDHEIRNDGDIEALETKVGAVLEELGYTWP